MALLLPIALAAGGRWRVLVAAAATVAILVAASVVLFGAEAWVGFFRQATLQRLLMENGDSAWHRMPTAFAALRLLGSSVAAPYIMQAGSAILAILATTLICRSNCS